MSPARRRPATTAAVVPWRRREVGPAPQPAANGGPAPERNGKQRNGFRVPAYTSTVPMPGPADSFAKAQQAGLDIMMSLARADAPPAAPQPVMVPAPALPAPPGAAPPGAAPPRSVPPDAAPPRSVPPDAAPPRSVPPRPATADPTAPDAVTSVPGRSSARRVRASQRRAAISRLAAFVAARPLAVILAAQTVLALRLVWSNTAFPDEALYLWSGRLEWAHWLHGSSLPNFPTYFSGAPVIYPPVAAVAAAAGGLVGGRILSLCFMLAATVLLHGVTRRIFDRRSADFAVALFAGLGATQFLAAFATYDAMALMLLALATWLSIRAAGGRLPAQIALLTAAAGALALADAAKYAATLFDPVVIVVAGLAAWRASTVKKGALVTVVILGVLSLLLLGGIRLGGHDYWRGITYTTLNRAHGASSARGIVADSLGWTALVLILAVIGCVVAIARTGFPARLCALVLTGALVLAPANQARIHVFTSLYKHVGFGSWFAAAVAGYALASLATAVPEIKKRGAVRAGAGVAAAGLAVGASLAHTHFVSWPNTTSFVAHLRPLLPAHRGRVLAADNGNVIEYYLPDELQGMVFSGPWFLRYQDPDTGQYLSGLPAYRDAIKHRYFSIIALAFGDSRATDQVISSDIRAYGGYQLIATVPYRAAGHASAFRIWVREGSG